MLWNPVTVSNNSPMLPRRAKVNRSDSNGLCAGRCPHEMESYLGFGEFCTWFMSWTMRVLPSVFCSNSGIRPNVLLPMALKITILLDLLINCLPAVTTAKRSVTLSLHNLKEKKSYNSFVTNKDSDGVLQPCTILPKTLLSSCCQAE